MNFSNISLAGGELQCHFCVVTKSFFNSTDDKDQDSLYLKVWFQTNEGKGLSYRDKSVKVDGNALYGFKISLATGKISKIQKNEILYLGQDGILNSYDSDMTYGWLTNNNDASSACRKQLDPILRNWLESYDINSLLKQCRREYIEDDIKNNQNDFDKLLKQAEELKIKIETMKIYNTIG